MHHVKPVTRTPKLAAVSGMEQVILLLFQIYFSGWDNFDSVYGNLQKIYGKTDE